jgi:hypothetical protein
MFKGAAVKITHYGVSNADIEVSTEQAIREQLSHTNSDGSLERAHERLDAIGDLLAKLVAALHVGKIISDEQLSNMITYPFTTKDNDE